MIKEKTILIKLHNTQVNHYLNLNYDIRKKIGSQGRIVYDLDSEIEVRVEDLPKGSHVTVTKLCDYNFEGCTQEVPNQFYQAVLRQRKNEKDGCFNCAYKLFVQEQGELKKIKVIERIKNRLDKGLSLNSKTMQKENLALYSMACNFFDSWENAINAAGLDYDQIREDSLRMGYYGQQFEKVLKRIFRDLYGNVKKGYSKHIRPDFNFGNGNWADAKLSEWTVDSSKTIEKYEPYCNQLTIVYLRGNKEKVERITSKTSIVSVYELIKLLSQEKQEFYTTLLDELWDKVNEQQEENYKNVAIDGDPNSPMGYLGVHWSDQKQRWCSEIIVDKKKIWIGQFASEFDCAKAYDSFILDNKLSKAINFGTNPLYKGIRSNHFGIYWDTRKNKWIAATSINKKTKQIGSFDSEVDAALAYNQYIIDHNLITSSRKLNVI